MPVTQSRISSERGLALALLGLALVAGRPAAATPPVTPNLIVIMTDDLDVVSLDALLASGLMPHLQELIDQGVRFQNSFVTNSECCPSRATYLTGLYSHNHKVYSNIGPQILQSGITWPGWLPSSGQAGREASTIASALAANGYYTGQIGKYLNGYGVSAPAGSPNPETYIPVGWNDWQGLIDPTTYNVYDYKLNDNGTVVSYGSTAADYQTDVIATRAVAFIERRAQAGAPFFLSLTPLAPHAEVPNPLDVVRSTDYRDGFNATIRPAPRHEHLADGNLSNGEVPPLVPKPSYNESDLSDKPSCPPIAAPIPLANGISFHPEPMCPRELPSMRADVDAPAVQATWRTRLASMLAIDDLLGSVVAALRAGGLYDRTAIVFTSDNGWFYGEHRLTGKVLAYEESIRVPLIIRAPGFAAGATASGVALNNDLAPTLAALAGVPLAWQVDGASLVPLLEVPGRSDWFRKSFLVEHFFLPSAYPFETATFAALRHLVGGDFLFTNWYANRTQPTSVTAREFYSLQQDPYQRQTLALPQSAANGLGNLLQQLRACAGQRCRDLESF
jgi:arylsulfatase A-like enzyme